jgi:hypothetical protein
MRQSAEGESRKGKNSMDQPIKETGTEEVSSKLSTDERRREAIRKLGRFAAYAAPFTLLAVNSNAGQSGSGSGGRTASSSAARKH